MMFWVSRCINKGQKSLQEYAIFAQKEIQNGGKKNSQKLGGKEEGASECGIYDYMTYVLGEKDEMGGKKWGEGTRPKK